MSITERYKKIPLLTKLFVGMALGVILGLVMGKGATVVEPIGTIFLNLLKMAALPLIIFNLISGICALDDPKIFGRVGGKIMIYYTATTAVAMVIGIAVATIVSPGTGFVLQGQYKGAIQKIPSLGETVINLIPTNIFTALSQGKFDQIVIFSAFCGIAILMLNQEDRLYMAEVTGKIAKMFNRMIGMVMMVAPFGVFALMATTVGKYGSMLVGFVAKYIGATYIAIIIMVCIYLILLFLFTGRSPIEFLKKAAPLMVTTASTSSSLACVPVSLECADSLGVSRSISSFTIPLGSQVNKDGNGIMLSLAVLFAAQAIGVYMPLATLVKVVFLGLILTTGAGGVPGSGIVSIAILIDAFGLPLEVVGIIAGIFALIDMGLTTLNCLGDLVGTVIVANSEKKVL